MWINWGGQIKITKLVVQLDSALQTHLRQGVTD